MKEEPSKQEKQAVETPRPLELVAYKRRTETEPSMAERLAKKPVYTELAPGNESMEVEVSNSPNPTSEGWVDSPVVVPLVAKKTNQ